MPTVAVAGVVFGSSRAHGAYDPTGWSVLGAILVLTAAALLLWGRRPTRLVAFASTALVLLGALALSSVAWGGLPDLAWRAFDQLALAAAALAAGSMLGTGHCRRFMLAGVWLGLVALAVDVLVELQAGSAPQDWFLGRRIGGPVGYHNALGALFATGVPLALWGASSSAVLLRFAAGFSLVLLESALLLTQSRGAVIAAALAVLTQVAVSRDIRLAAIALLGAGAGAVLLLPLRAVDAALVTTPGGDPAVFRRFVLWAVLGALGIGVASSTSTRSRLTRRLLVGATSAIISLGLLGVLVARPDLPVRLWDNIRQATAIENPARLPAGNTRLTSLSLNGRARVWRVAADSIAAKPILGTGAGTFARTWGLKRGGRHEGDTFYVLQAHSVELDVLTELGAVGALLFVAFLALVVIAIVRARTPRTVRAVGAAVLVALLAQASVDWTFSFSALVASALLVVGAAAGGRRPSVSQVWVAVVEGVVALALLASFAAPGYAAHLLGQAKEANSQDPARAWQIAERAHRFDRWSSDVVEFQGLLAESGEQYRLAEGLYRRAASLSQQPWVGEYLLARALHSGGHMQASAAACRVAQEENPAEELLRHGVCSGVG